MKSQIFTQIEKLKKSKSCHNIEKLIDTITSKFEAQFILNYKSELKQKALLNTKYAHCSTLNKETKSKYEYCSILNKETKSNYETKSILDSNQELNLNYELKLELERKYLTYFVKKIEIDNLKKIYIYLKF